MRQVTPTPDIRVNDWDRLRSVLRDVSEAVNQAARGYLHKSVTVSAAYSASPGDIMIYVSPAGAFTVTLPAAKDTTDKVIRVKRKNNTTHTITIQASSGNIDGAASTTLTTAYQTKAFHSDGSNYYTV